MWLINACSNAVLFLFGVRSNDTELESLTRDELRTLVHEAGSRISSRYQQMLISILDLERVTVDDVMVPHNEIIGIDLEDDPQEIERIIDESQHTRLPVYRDTIDNVLGILHLRKLANLAKRHFDAAELEKLLEEPYFVPRERRSVHNWYSSNGGDCELHSSLTNTETSRVYVRSRTYSKKLLASLRLIRVTTMMKSFATVRTRGLWTVPPTFVS